MAMSRGILSTDPQYKEWKQKNKTTVRTASTINKQKTKPANVPGKLYSELTPEEKRKVDRALALANAEQRQRAGLKNIIPGAEYRTFSVSMTK